MDNPVISLNMDAVTWDEGTSRDDSAHRERRGESARDLCLLVESQEQFPDTPT
jgi:hypothetical protein